MPLYQGAESFYSNLKKLIPDLPEPWCTPHHFARVFARTAAKRPAMKKHLETAEALVSFISTPKRWSFISGVCHLHDVPLGVLQNVADQRWAPSVRDLVKAVVLSLGGVSLGMDAFLDEGFFDGAADKSGSIKKVEGFRVALRTHGFLAALHLWADVLEVEAWATKMMESGDSSMLTRFALLSALPARIDELRDDRRCANYHTYMASLTHEYDDKHLPVVSRVMYTKKTLVAPSARILPP